ncbi:MAG TPA: stage II sporulation protein M [Bacillota bacterium]|nr:stage II sporulation protein M [Bacillota bacterium]
MIFFSSFAITFTIIRPKPALAGRIVPSQTLIQMEESYRSGINKERSFTTKNFMVSFYIQNNISIAFGCFALGVLLGMGTIYVLIYNGITLGAITGYVIGKGYGQNFFTFTTAHSAAELTGLVLAGASGLALGFAIIKATRYYRKEWLAIERPNIFSLVAGSACLLFLAAMIEGMISPSLLPYSFKAGMAILTLILILSYFLLWPGLRMMKRPQRERRPHAPSTGVSK